MSLDRGRHYLAIPGPSVIPDRVLQAMHRPAPNIYEGDLVSLMPGIVSDLKQIAGTNHQAAIYICNGHGAWEAAISNTLSRGDKILVLGTGRFCIGWGETARTMGIELDTIDFGFHSDIEMSRVAEALSADKSHKIKAVLAVHVDTSTSVKNDIKGLRQTLDDVGHPALLFSDNIASLGCDPFFMDKWGVDLMVTACQKGLMTPPGLSFVFFNEKADEARDRADLVTPYWDWRLRANPEVFYQHFCGTAPTHHLYGLREALDMLVHEEGLEQAWKRHETLSAAIWAALDAWGQAGEIAPNITAPGKRSHAVTTVNVGSKNGIRLRHWIENNYGVTLGIPLGVPLTGPLHEDDFLRIGHMGHVSGHMVMGVLAGLQAGMIALNIPHDSSGLDAAAQVIAARA